MHQHLLKFFITRLSAKKIKKEKNRRVQTKKKKAQVQRTKKKKESDRSNRRFANSLAR